MFVVFTTVVTLPKYSKTTPPPLEQKKLYVNCKENLISYNTLKVFQGLNEKVGYKKALPRAN